LKAQYPHLEKDKDFKPKEDIKPHQASSYEKQIAITSFDVKIAIVKLLLDSKSHLLNLQYWLF
jgi:hypothetical protein